MTSSSLLSKKQAQNIARSLQGQSHLEISKILNALGLLNGHHDTIDVPKASTDMSVGLWRPIKKPDGLWFERCETLDNWPSAWSIHGDIPPKSNRRRLVLLGESVARGMHYDPFLTPAQVLEEYLGQKDWEVIDLARIDGSMQYLVHVLPRCLQLQPDAILIFAGHNWHSKTQRNTFIQRYIEVIEACESLSQIPVFHLLPEYNRIDWDFSNSRSVASNVPHANDKIQQRLRTFSKSGRLKLFDWPAFLQDNSIAADRHLFLDYCHLTLQGIALAMRFAADQIEGFFLRDVVKTICGPSYHSCLIADLPLEKKAAACFCVALYNNRFGQNADIIGYHLQKSFDFYPKSSEFMTRFFRHNITETSKGLNTQYFNTLPFFEAKLLTRLSLPKANWFLLSLVIKCMTTQHELGSMLFDLVDQYHHIDFEMLENKRVSLLRSTLVNSCQFMNKTALYRIPIQPQVSFDFLWRIPADCQLILCIRCLEGARQHEMNQQSLAISINSTSVALISIQNDWLNHELILSAQHFRKGHNSIEFHFSAQWQDISFRSDIWQNLEWQLARLDIASIPASLSQDQQPERIR